MFKKLLFLSGLFALNINAASVNQIAISTAKYAEETYHKNMVDSLSRLVKYNTVAVQGIKSTDNPIHQEFKQELAKQAEELGLDYQDKGYLVIIGLGSAKEKLGLIAHGDIQPAAPEKWAKSPYELDKTSEPGKLIARGTEDDKSAISSALYAMKAIKDKKLTLKKRIELYIYMAEESDWEPLKEYVKHHKLPDINITLDASYPVVTAEKGYGSLKMTFPINNQISSSELAISHFSGGFFASQIPEDAKVVIENVDQTLLEDIKHKSDTHTGISYQFLLDEQKLTISAKGKSAHSSAPEDGINAITHLAELLAFKQWPNNAYGSLVNFINDNLGTGLYGEKFGDIAYFDDFMGHMTVSPTVIKEVKQGIELNINTRRPQGKTAKQLQKEINQALVSWQKKNNVKLKDISTSVGTPFVQNDVPHLDTLLTVFSHYTGIINPKPISIGGGTNSRLFPNAVSFGPSMPGSEYTGHTEHEFITLKQFKLNLQMYTAVMVELAL